MILSGKEIEKNIGKDIKIEPFTKSRLNPNSYNVSLFDELLVYEGEVLDMKIPNETKRIKIPKEGLVLEPNKLYLGRTNEYTETDKFVPMLEGRSSVGRLGMCIHVTAGFGDVGFKGYWTLEITVAQPLKIYPNVEVGQIYYHDIEGDYELYGSGKYNKNKDIQASMLYKDFEKEKLKLSEDDIKQLYALKMLDMKYIALDSDSMFESNNDIKAFEDNPDFIKPEEYFLTTTKNIMLRDDSSSALISKNLIEIIYDVFKDAEPKDKVIEIDKFIDKYKKDEAADNRPIFRLEDYKGDYAMNCRTKEEDKVFRRFLDNKGREWDKGQKYTELTYWDRYKKNTVYVLNEGICSSINGCGDCIILKFSDFNSKSWEI